jgi:hypothetical protein
MAFRSLLKVRFGDIDHAGIVYYPRFLHCNRLSGYGNIPETGNTKLAAPKTGKTFTGVKPILDVIMQ